MCGIVGYIGRRDATGVLIQGLKRLEYRGYDSFGLATVGSAIEVYKKVGRISDQTHAKHTKFSIHVGIEV